MEEKGYLQKIDELHQWLLNEPYGRYEHHQLWPPDGRLFANKAEQLLDLALHLQNEHHPEYCSILPQHVGSIKNHEINRVRISYGISNRSNARKKDKESFVQSLFEANGAINRLLYTLFEHIKELQKTIEHNDKEE